MERTPEEIKKGLECCAGMRDHSYCLQCPYADEDCDEMSRDALALIEQLEDQIRDLTKKVQAQSGTDMNVPRWISVEDEMPEDDVEVLVYAIGDKESSIIAMTSYTHHMHGYNIEGWRSPWQYFFYNYKITHWMPLPEAPEEGRHEAD